ncbi:Heat shock protein. Metallo peptidase. MEROPS family M48B [Leifsonia sp. 98AMF]|jgi:heat shock protein HtpX|uniref:M48 family metalloprotease n=1 Tax=unclassified Leifsonia TaxID=2663824 RepID=UPI000879E318|nr:MULTISPECIES: M48 family metalloprotease [unclassified Leifsonia]SDH47785.1 Heat shock protein. Metallo peptidase. MEROPS family M48B [Leifsonia sp. 197AMF]SDI89791.1 Heat shock protein. Metallo peptidase. MEROPS family M48B [Leifsonia sp. 466MF]SDJ90747.1 Heat shock protein. Metallo peptidase. MEROPS family M48B [Leifsonia sp. 157MF]SDN93491.1 Heat shock protein. Metallo peptidase. MEROPS family M48B [Leifsonia sp. 509MF]SEN12232.1 Heat shock protein. Metallo peptidase. MEROPS family M48B 
MYRAIARNKRNTVFIILLFLVLIGALGWLAAYIYQSYTILVVVLVGAVLYALFQYYLASSQALSMSGAIPIQKADNPRLWNVVENLSIATGTPMPAVYIVNDPAPNAFATGRDPEHASVAATTGLLDIMTDAELEGVMAHELGHVRNYDIRLGMIVFGLTVAIGFIADIFLRMAFFGGNRNNNNGGGNPVVLVFGLIAAIVAPLVATLVQLAVSRQREYLADATGAMTTRHPDALASALLKLEAYGRPMQKQNSSMAHLWINDPLKPGLMARLFSTHPPIPQRVERLEEMGGSF